MEPILSIIIPTLNEARTITRVIDAAAPDDRTEVLVVDGGSTDPTCALAAQGGALVLHSSPGRARQLNTGAARATGRFLLFLHGDTLLPAKSFDLIDMALQQPAIACGAFSLRIDSQRRALHCIAAMANLRSRLFHLPYGDQGLFTTSSSFQRAGGFPDLPIMEDYAFVRRMARFGKIATLKQAVTTSSRRWENMGLLKTTLLNQVIVAGYLVGVSPSRLARWYQRAKGVGEGPHA